MRIFTLSFLVLCGLLPQFLIAQNRLPAGLRHLPTDLSPELTTALDGLFPAVVTGDKPGRTTKSFGAELVLDSTITYEPVDAGGGITTNVPVSRSVITREGNLVTTTESEFENNSWTPISESRSFRDALDRDRLQVLLAWDEDTDAWINVLRLETFYRGNSTELLDSLFVDVYDGTADDWQDFIHLRFSYDDQNRLSEVVSMNYILSATDPTTSVETYRYNEAGENDEIIIAELEGNDTLVSSLIRLAYENGQATEYTSFYLDFDGETYVPDERITYTYTADGQQDSIVTYLYDYDAEDWEAISLEDYDYDADGRLTDQYVITYQPGGEDDITRETFTYISGTDYVTESEYLEYDYTSETYLLVQSTTYFYSGDITSTLPLAEGEALRAWPNPATQFLRVDLAEPAALLLYDQTGKLMSRGQYLPGQGIDLAGLPSGMYLISLTTRTARYRVRVMKG